MEVSKEGILKDIHKRLSQAYKVNFIPFEQFEKEFNFLSLTFMKRVKPIEDEYKRLKKSKDIDEITVDKSKYI